MCGCQKVVMQAPVETMTVPQPPPPQEPERSTTESKEPITAGTAQ